PEHFFGRAQEVTNALSLVRNNQSVSIVGPRRIGKTSFLLHISHPEVMAQHGLPADEHIFVFIDCEGLSRLDQAGFYRVILEDTEDQLLDQGIDVEVHIPDTPTYRQFERTLRKLNRQGLKFIYLLDEFELMSENHNLDADFFSGLRGLSARHDVCYVTASQAHLLELSYAEGVLGSPFFNIFAVQRLGLFSQDEALQLIHGPSQTAGVPFSDAMADFILDLAGPHPLFLNITCFHTFPLPPSTSSGQALVGGGPGRGSDPSEDQLQVVQRKVLGELEGHFRYYWSKLDDGEKETLASLEQIAQDETARVMARRLEQHGLVVRDDGGYRHLSTAFAGFVGRQVAEEGTRGAVAGLGAALVGRRLGPYVITEELGQGGMARVYKGRHAELKRDVAVKILFAHLADDADFLGRFRREAQAVAALRHPHIVQVHDFGAHDRLYYMVMEYITGGTLKERLAGLKSSGDSLPLADAMRIVEEVADALDYAHTQGVVHRDIKPSNIMFSDAGRAILTDFGIAKLIRGTAVTREEMMGTPTYMSPEQIQATREVDRRTDVYALGAVLYEMVAGQPPFAGDTPMAVALKHMSDPVPPPRSLNPDLPEAIEPVVLKALAKEPGARYQTAGELAEALARAFGGEGPPGGPGGEEKSGGAEERRSRGAEEQRSRGAEGQRSRGDKEILPISSAPPPPPPFASAQIVGREMELAALGRRLEEVIAGESRIVFITGEAGTGKTTLAHEFLRLAQAAYPDLVVAVGECNAQLGRGDAYLPFREILALLTGDVEIKLAEEAITPENASRLRRLLVQSGQIVGEVGPDLIGVFVPGAGLVTRLAAVVADTAGWWEKLEGRVAHQDAPARGEELTPDRLFEQYRRVLAGLARQQPLALLLDDLHWADDASLELLFYLGRSLRDVPVLLIGTYRPSDVALGPPLAPDERHSLESVVNEFKRYFGEVEISLEGTLSLGPVSKPLGPVSDRAPTAPDKALARSETGQSSLETGQSSYRVEMGRAFQFVSDYIDAAYAPHQLEDDFKQLIARRTEGHALFTVELLRDLAERGVLAQTPSDPSAAPVWAQTHPLDFADLPARVDGVIGERIGRLEAPLREILTVASVEGEEFTAQVVAHLAGADERLALRHLAQDLAGRHRLVQERGVETITGRRLYLYEFRNRLFQQYVYGRLSEVEREFLHGDVAAYLEHLYQAQAPQIAVQLAYHFERGQNMEKALTYLIMAGDQARQAHAHATALDFYSRAEGLAESLDAAPALQSLHERLADVCDLIGRYDEALYQYRLLLTPAGGDPTPLRRAQIGRKVGRIQVKRGQHDVALATLKAAREVLDTAETSLDRESRLELVQLERQTGWAHLFRGDYEETAACCDRALSGLEQIAELRDEGELDWQQSEIEILLGHIGYRQGRFAEATGHFERSMALKQILGDRMGEAVVDDNLGFVCLAQQDLTGALEHHHRSLKIRRELGSMAGVAASLHNLGDMHLQRGEYDQAVQHLEETIRVCQEIAMPAFLPQTHKLLSEAYLALGKPDTALHHARAASRADRKSPAVSSADIHYRLLIQLDKTLISL
ncbi:MAG: protein kinase, partial [Anaerolineae bacterium]